MKDTVGDEFEELQIKDASKTLAGVLRNIDDKNEVDLLHVNCEVNKTTMNQQNIFDYPCKGCEWEMFENLISSDFHNKVRLQTKMMISTKEWLYVLSKLL